MDSVERLLHSAGTNSQYTCHRYVGAAYQPGLRLRQITFRLWRLWCQVNACSPALGLTVTKLRNRLKPDAVEAFQCMKHAMHGDTLVRLELHGDLDEDNSDVEELEGYISRDEDDVPA